MAASKALKFGPHLRELRIHLCQQSEASKGVREFIEKYYVPIKKSNPYFPILIREASGVQPKLHARYEFGKETSMGLNNFSSDQVFRAIESLSQKQ